MSRVGGGDLDGTVEGARLEARQVVCAYGETIAVDHADVVAEPGRITVLIGPNGAGKTTLFNALAGETLPVSGTVHLDERDVTRLPPDQRTRLGLARTFQQSTVFASLTVEENLQVGAENRHHDGTLRGLIGLSDHHERRAARRVDATLATLGLKSLRRVRAGGLPTGTLRLIELARALCSEPTVLLLDEPASGLDDDETEELHDTLHRLAGRGLTIVMVEHDLDLVREAADVIYVMVTGAILASGAPDVVLARDDVRKTALGLT